MPLTPMTPRDEGAAVAILASAFVEDNLTREFFRSDHSPVDEVLLGAYFSAELKAAGQIPRFQLICRAQDTDPPQGVIVAYVESEDEKPPYEDFCYDANPFIQEYGPSSGQNIVNNVNNRWERWFQQDAKDIRQKVSEEYSGRSVYLLYTGVHADWQGKGLGSKFLAEFHEQVDAMVGAHAVYVEAKNPGAKQFFERNGYDLLGELDAQNLEPGEKGGSIWPMVRRPAS